jgi:hypothetical protein
MIVFDLLCDGGHRFEGWFGSAEDYAKQKERSLLCCPVCGVARVERVPSAARLNLGAVEAPAPEKPDPVAAQMEGKDAFAVAQMLYSRMLDQLLEKTEDVGTRFPEEARRIHYQEAPARGIRGQATQQEHDELLDEGIQVARFPIPDSGSWN